MADFNLRDPFQLAAPSMSPGQLEALDASSMGSLRRGYESGRLAGGASYNSAREANLRAAGDKIGADRLREESAALKQRASIYAPPVGRVEDIGGLGDAASYVGGQVGQGAAAMQDPVVLSAAATGVGNVLAAIPNPVAKVLGASLRVAAPVAAFVPMQRQMTGQMYDSMMENPTIARQDPTSLRDTANLYGAGAAGLGAIVPGMVGKQLGGAALARGAARASAGTLVGGEVASNAAAGYGQELASQKLLSHYDPNRDTSGDSSALLNAAVGGAVQAGVPAVGGALAEHAYAGVGKAGRKVVDVAAGASQKAQEAVGRAGEALDLGALRQGLRKASKEPGDAALDDMNLLRGNPPPDVAADPQKFGQWMQDTAQARTDRVQKDLRAMAAAGDDVAAQHQAAIHAAQAGAGADLMGALDAGADYIVEVKGLHDLAARADDAATRAPKKNNQGAPWTGDELEARRQRAMNAFDDAAATAKDRQRSAGRAQLMGEYLVHAAEAQKQRFSAHRVDASNVPEYMRKLGEQIGDIADSWGMTGKQEPAGDKKGQQFDNLKFSLESIARSMRAAYGDEAPAKAEELRKMAGPDAAPLFDYLDSSLDAAKGRNAEQAAGQSSQAAYDEMLSRVDPGKQAELLKGGTDLRTPGARKYLMQQLSAVSDGTMPPAGRAALDKLLGRDNVERMADVLHRPSRQALEVDRAYDSAHDSGLVLGADNQAHAVAQDATDESRLASQGDFEQRQAEKLVPEKYNGRMYGAENRPRPITDLETRGDPFAKNSEGNRPRLFNLADHGDKIEARRQQMLDKLGGDSVWDAQPKSALEIMAERAGVSLSTLTGERNRLTADHERPGRDAASEKSGLQAPFLNKMFATFRDYMAQEGKRHEESDPAKSKQFYALKKRADALLLDRVDQSEGKATTRTTAGEREKLLNIATRYLSEHGMVVAERGTNVDPQQITADRVMKMAVDGKALYDVARKDGENRNDLLAFKSKLADSKKGEGTIFLKVNDVAAFAREARERIGQGENEGIDANKRQLRDIMDGIAALVSSGHVDGLPSGFSDGKIPDHLPLKTTTYGALEWGRQKRVEKAREATRAQEGKTAGGDARENSGHQERVAKEQGRDYYTADPLTVQDRDVVPSERTDQHEFEQHQIATRAAGMEAKNIGAGRTLARMRMMDYGPVLGDELSRTLHAGFDDGVQLAKMYLRQADDKAPQYLFPVIHALDGANYEAIGRSPAEKATVRGLRAEAARRLIDSTLGPKDKVLLARMLAKPEGRDKLTAQNAKGFLGKVADSAKEDVTGQAPVPLTKKQRDAASDAAIAEHAAAKEDAAQAGKSQPLPNGAADWSDTGRKLNSQARALHEELGRPGFAAAHNSPIKHEGKFNWREHLGKGEGAWVYGAGTYLSTDDSVHRYYKKQFSGVGDNMSDRLNEAVREARSDLGAKATAAEIREHAAESLRESLSVDDDIDNIQIHSALRELKNISDARLLGTPSPTYEVSVDIPSERVMDWSAPLSEQPASIRLRALKAIKELGIEESLDALRGEDLYREVKQHFDTVINKERMKGEAATDPSVRTSDYLQSLGILGHSYKSNSRSGLPNYVIYDDSKIHTNFVAFNKQKAKGQPATPEQIKEAHDYLKKILPDVKVEFEKLTGHSGEWIEADNVIKISTTAAAGTMQTAYHEALHAFFSKYVKGDPRAFEVLKSLAETPELIERAHALLDGFPAAQADFARSGEERLAYMYQFWAAGLLDLPTKPATLFGKIARFFRAMLGRITDQERAASIFQALHQGDLAEPSAAGQVIAKAMKEGTWTTSQLHKYDGAMSKLRGLAIPSHELLMGSESKAAQELGREFYTNPGRSDQGGDGEGYINSRLRKAMQYKGELAKATMKLSERDMRDVAKYLQQEAKPEDIPFAPHRQAVKEVRALLQRFRRYMVDERGMDIGNLGKNYYPRAWDSGVLQEKQGDFLDMLKKNYDAQLQAGVDATQGKFSKDQVAMRIWSKLVGNTLGQRLMPERTDGVLAPFFANAEIREMKWLGAEHAEPFMSKDLLSTMSRYFSSGARMAEYTARFGQDGKVLADKLAQIRNELDEAALARLTKGEFANKEEALKWSKRQSEQLSKAVGAMEGTLGNDVNSTWRQVSTWMTVYQNTRLLPLALFSSVVDPLGLVARGGTMKEAYDTFLRGMKEVVSTWGDMAHEKTRVREGDKWDDLARAVGVVDHALFSSFSVNDDHTGMYMSRRAQAFNDKLFKLNGMEAWNRGMRAGATKSAVQFLTRHAQQPNEHSTRWLAELGLTKSDLAFDSDGQLITDKNALATEKGISKPEAERRMEKVHFAIARWVQGAILTPNAAQRPGWASDPHYSMFFHLKQFSYSFHQTIMRRAVNELNYGNMVPMGSFLWYVPIMIASDITKGLLQGGGSLPKYMQGMTAGDWMMRGAERAGVLGLGNIGVDASHDIWSVAGPAVEQSINAFTHPIGRTLTDALPGKPLFAGLTS